MYCKNCGQRHTSGKFCEYCGATITPMQSDPLSDNPYSFSSSPENITYTEPKPDSDPGQNLGVASLVLGIVSIVLGSICSCTLSCFGGALPFVAAIIGLIVGIMGRSRSKAAGFKNNMALAGWILCAVSLVIIIAFSFILFALLNSPDAYTIIEQYAF